MRYTSAGIPHFIKQVYFWANFGEMTNFIDFSYNDVKINQEIFDSLFEPKLIISDSFKWYDGYACCRTKSSGTRIDSLLGKAAPGWELFDYRGKKFSMADFKGKVVLMDFWFRGCAPCNKSYPGLDRLFEKFKDKGLVVLGLNPFDTNQQLIMSFIEKKNINFTVLLKAGECAKQYKIAAYPTLLIIDKKGIIRKITEGFNEQNEKELEKLISKLL